MNSRFIHACLFVCVSLVATAAPDVLTLSKAQELTQAQDFVSRLSATTRSSKRPIVGVLHHWEVRVNTYSEDYDEQLERSAIYPVYYECCRKMERLYGSKVATYRAEDSMGYPSQMTIVEFEDVDLGKSHLIVGLWEGNDSTGFYFRHLPGAFDIKKGWKRRESWNLEGTFLDAKKPAEQTGSGQPLAHPEPKSEGGDKSQPTSKGRSQ